MNWYRKSIIAALEPGAWKEEESPARLVKDLPAVTMPWGGKVFQPQDLTQLQSKYEGVHLTPSAEIAFIYANTKASEDDPPVIIEIDPTELEKELDVDATVDFLVSGYIDGMKNEWGEIIEQNENYEDAASELLESIDRSADMMETYEGTYDVSDIISAEAMRYVPSVLNDYLMGKDDNEVVAIMGSIVQGNIPKEVYINTLQQFRVMHPIISDRVRGIYQVPWANLGTSSNIGNIYEMDDEQLKEEGYERSGDNIYDKEGRLIIDYEDVMYGHYLKLTPLYVNKQAYFKGMEGEESVWHGTTFKRAQQAFPDLL